jgi:osmotically-inducible protein OsmY
MATKTKAKHDARPDDQIALDIRRAMKLDSDVPDERIRVEVHNGLTTLEGSVDRSFQKEAAEDDAIKVKGVRGVTNRIEVLPATMLGAEAR